MGRSELLEALQREGRETLAAIAGRRTAEEERRRGIAAERRAELRRSHQEECERLCSARKRLLLAQASKEAALIRLRAEAALALRLAECARSMLPKLRSDDAERLFRLLAAELPPLPWQRIWTAPDDSCCAAALFPAATIIADPTLSGGIKAATSEDSLTIDNTLATRLEKLWPDLLPQLLEELREDSP